MSPQEVLSKLLADEYALSKKKGQQLGPRIDETRKHADACREMVRSARNPKHKQALTEVGGSTVKLMKRQIEHLKGYQKNAEFFGKAKKDLESAGNPQRLKGPYDTASLRSALPTNQRKR